MSNFDWVVVGCGGHGKEVAALVETFLLTGDTRILGWLDDNEAKWDSTVAGLQVLGGLDWIARHGQPLNVAVAIGSCTHREMIVNRIKGLGAEVQFPVLRHPGANIGPRVTLGEGALIQAGCILTCDIEVGPFAVLNIGVTLSHDAKVGPFSSLHPGVRLAGGASVGHGAELGMGTHVIPLGHVGDRARTGALAAVVRDIAPQTTSVGVPARPLVKK